MRLRPFFAAVFVGLFALSGCSSEAPDSNAVEADSGVEPPDLHPRFCSPGTSDPANCKTCVGGIMTSWCASGEFCYGGVCKTDTRAAGSACTSSSQCATSYCTDGVCCNVSSCSGSCSFCGSSGSCVIKTGVAPKSCALTVGSAPCGTPGCYGSASCSYPGSSTSCTGKCVGDATTGFNYGGSGACDGTAACKVTAGATACGTYRCSDSSGCLSSCTTDADCLTTAYCDGGTCKPKVSTGSACIDDRACAAGAGACQATNDGKRCCTASCTAPQVCDTVGTGCVGSLPVGASCTTGSACITGKCHPTGKCAQCLGDSDCPSTRYCDTTTLECLPRAGVGETCTSTASCPSGLSCTEGVCCEAADCGAGKSCALTHKGQCMKTAGTTCGADAECDSGHCIDGVCCDAACKGQCEACDVAGSVGKCVAVKGAPHGTRTACPGTEVSLCERAMCDGAARDACKGYTSSSEECRKASCTAGVATAPATCTGNGSCPDAITTPCGGYACDAEGVACRSACDTDAHCIEGYECRDSKCQPKTSTCSDDRASSVPRDGAPKACAPFACDPSSGNCFDKCSSTAQCGAGFVCDGTTCVPAPASSSSEDDGGCTLSPHAPHAPQRTHAHVLAILGVAGLALASRRRSSR